MVADKASQAEVAVLSQQLSLKAEREEVEALADRMSNSAPEATAAAAAAAAVMSGDLNSKIEKMMSGRPSKDDVTALAQQVGDLYSQMELMKGSFSVAQEQTSLSKVMSDTSGHSDASAAMKLASALAKELQVRDGRKRWPGEMCRHGGGIELGGRTPLNLFLLPAAPQVPAGARFPRHQHPVRGPRVASADLGSSRGRSQTAAALA